MSKKSPTKPAKRKTPAKRAQAKGNELLIPEKITPLVFHLRREKVLLDADLAALYGVETKALNQAVKRNLDRFPEDFMFQLTVDEWKSLRSQIVTSPDQPVKGKGLACNRSQIVTGSAKHRSSRARPYAFTEQGVAMLSSVLRSPRAVEVNIAIMRTFVQLRKLMDSNRDLAKKIEKIEAKYAEHEQKFQLVFDAIKQLITPPASGTPKREIGFHQIPKK